MDIPLVLQKPKLWVTTAWKHKECLSDVHTICIEKKILKSIIEKLFG
jgi:hypothetical protein